MSAKFQPGDEVLYCPTGEWSRAHTLEAVVLGIVGPEAGTWAGCIKIRLTGGGLRTATYSTRFVRADKVRLRKS